MLRSNLRQTAKFNLIILDFDKVMMLREITQRIFTFHKAFIINYYYLTINKGLKHTNCWDVTVFLNS